MANGKRGLRDNGIRGLRGYGIWGLLGNDIWGFQCNDIWGLWGSGIKAVKYCWNSARYAPCGNILLLEIFMTVDYHGQQGAQWLEEGGGREMRASWL